MFRCMVVIFGLPEDGRVLTDETYILTAMAEDDESDEWELSYTWYIDLVGEGRVMESTDSVFWWNPGGDGRGKARYR